MINYVATCHCGNLKANLNLPSAISSLISCNCSICEMLGYLHLHVKRSQVELVVGELGLVEYKFNTLTARHLFCPACGIKPLYQPRSHPNGYSVNARCIVGFDLSTVEVIKHDGRNWEASISSLAAHPVDEPDLDG